MTTKDRPLSPHLQIYRLPMLGKLSILHRITGVFLSIAAVVLPIVLWSLTLDSASFDCLAALISSWYGQVIAFGVSFSLIYHALNGVRHLIWDMGYNLQVIAAERSGYVVIILTLLLSCGLWFAICSRLYGGDL